MHIACSVLIQSLFTQGPEFVRKHIFNKHAEKIEEVKKEVAFFNNFLTDAKRPALPEIKPAQPPGPAQSKIRSMRVCHIPSPLTIKDSWFSLSYDPLKTFFSTQAVFLKASCHSPPPIPLPPPAVIHVSVHVVLPPGLTPGLPYPHQTPQGLMPYGQPRPPILGYGGKYRGRLERA